jgi:hypothetical protein
MVRAMAVCSRTQPWDSGSPLTGEYSWSATLLASWNCVQKLIWLDVTGILVVTVKSPIGVQLFPTWIERTAEHAPPSAVPLEASKQQWPFPVEQISDSVWPSLKVAVTRCVLFWLTTI